MPENRSPPAVVVGIIFSMDAETVTFRGLPERVDVGDDITLRRVTEGDIPALVDAVNATLDTLAPWMEWAQQPLTVDGQMEWYRGSTDNWDDGTGFNWAVLTRAGELIGGAGFHVRNGPGVLEIGYWLRRDYEGRGIMTRVAAALTDVARGIDGVTCVEIHVDPDNVRSAAIPRRLGYTLAEIRDVERLAPAHTGTHQIWRLQL
jgi:RimJ/RimL family protein N-acetyltransferase